jgi:predicted Ser/Thr protein kinase
MENKIKEIILREFDSDTINIRRITEGYSHFMYDVKITKDPYELIIRFSNNKNEEVTLEKEKYVMEILNENGIPAPKIYVFNEEYMIMERIRGSD